MKTLVIIPCYNEEENLDRVVERLHAAAPDVDYLIVNDCSTDGSAALCRARGYNYISLPVNLGIGGGVQSGYLYAREHGYDVTVQMDGDGQHNPLFLADVVRPWPRGRLDMCIGSRFITKEGFQTSFMRRLGINFISVMIRLLCGVRILDTTSGFRACNKELTAYFCRPLRPGLPGAGGHHYRCSERLPRGRSPGRHGRAHGRQIVHQPF